MFIPMVTGLHQGRAIVGLKAIGNTDGEVGFGYRAIGEDKDQQIVLTGNRCK
jgi:hypothetical protein